MAELKPCPFCGGEAEMKYLTKRKFLYDRNGNVVDYVIGYANYGTSKQPVKISCKKCRAEMRYSNRTIATKKWNRRVENG